MWATALAALLSALIPLFTKFAEKKLREWLERRLREEAATLDSDTSPEARDLNFVMAEYGIPNAKQKQVILLRRVRDSLYVWQRAKRRLLDAAIKHVEG